MAPTSSPASGSSSQALDPWKALVDVSLDGHAGLRRSLRWLRILAQSGFSAPLSTCRCIADSSNHRVDTSIEVLSHIESLCAGPDVPFAAAVDLSEAIFASAWSRTINRKAIADIAVRLYLSQHATVKASLDKDRETDTTWVHRLAA